MVNLGFVTGFVRPYPGTRRDGQLRICHRLCMAVPRYGRTKPVTNPKLTIAQVLDAMVNFLLCNIPQRFWRASQVTFCHLACTPVPRYECASGHFSMWRPSKTHTCHIPTPPACTPVPRYGRTSQVTICHLACTLASMMQLVRLKISIRILTWWPRLTQGYGWCVGCCSPKATGRSTKDGENHEDRYGLESTSGGSHEWGIWLLHGESPRILTFLFILEPCMNVMFVMGWSLKMRHACDFMVIERIGSLMNMSYWNLISWRHDMALFCFRHGQLQMREGFQSPWGQSAQSDQWMK